MNAELRAHFERNTLFLKTLTGSKLLESPIVRLINVEAQETALLAASGTTITVAGAA